MWNLYSQVFFCWWLAAGVAEGLVGEPYRLVPLEQDHTTALVASCEVVARLVEFDGGDDVG